MNFRPLLIGACACGLIAALLYRQVSTPKLPPPEGLVAPSAENPFVPPQGAVPVEPANNGRGDRTPVAGKPAEAAATVAKPELVAQPTPEQLLAARARITPAGSPPVGLQGAELGEDPYGFEAKYAGQDSAQIMLALEAVEAILAWQGGGLADKSQALPLEELAALQLEQQWLKQKAFP